MNGQGSIAGVNIGQSVQLQWDANTESDLAGYKVYYSCNKVYPRYNGTQAWQGASPVTIGNRTSYTLSGLPDTCEYWSVAVTAYNATAESDYSNIVTWEFGNEKVRHLAIGAMAEDGMIASDGMGGGASTGVGQILFPYSTITDGVGATAGADTSFTVAAGSVIYPGVGATAGIGSMTATGIISETFGQGARTGVGRLRTLNAVLSPLKVVKYGNGDVDVTANGISCGADCEVDIPYGQSLTLSWAKNTAMSDFYSWGHACQYAENRTSCTVTADTAGQRLFVMDDGYIWASVMTGSFDSPIARVRGYSNVIWYPTMQACYNAISNGIITGVIDVITKSGDGPLVMANSIAVELVGGWKDFMPGQLEGTTYITGGLTVKYGSLTIGSYNGGGSVTIK